MIKISTIRASAQARLLIFRVFATKLTEVERRLLATDPYLWERVILNLEKEISANDKNGPEQNVLTRAFSHIDRSTREGLQKQIQRMTGQTLWLGTHSSLLLDAFIDEHLKFINSVRQEHLEKIGFALKRGMREGRLYKELAKDIGHLTDVSKRRAQLIARNAPLHYSGALTKHHQMSSGIRSYIWQTSRDERVRESHRKYDGEIFDWDSPGPHPRSEINCRCDAIPNLKG